MKQKPYAHQICEDDPMAIDEFLSEDPDCESFPDDREIAVNDLLDEYDEWSGEI